MSFTRNAVSADAPFDAIADLPLLETEAVPPRIAAALQAMREGRPVVLQDDHDREDEADLVCAAERLTNETMALFIRECSGIVCLCPTRKSKRSNCHRWSRITKAATALPSRSRSRRAMA
jgi:3,4-dihydroxy 2-butanone 4-phosphate synthase